MPNWRNLNPRDGPENCKRAMEVAEKHFKIPMVLEPEYLSSPHLDELSGMTYLSYFMKEEDSPGYYATLNWVKNQIPNQRINNFRVMCQIVADVIFRQQKLKRKFLTFYLLRNNF